MAGALKLQDWQLRRVLSAAARADDAFLRYAVQACADVDLRLKSVACEPYAAVGHAARPPSGVRPRAEVGVTVWKSANALF